MCFLRSENEYHFLRARDVRSAGWLLTFSKAFIVALSSAKNGIGQNMPFSI